MLFAEIGSNWGNLFDPGTGTGSDLSMANVFVMLLVDIVFYWVLACYLDAVRPGPYGLSKPFYFPLTVS